MHDRQPTGTEPEQSAATDADMAGPADEPAAAAAVPTAAAASAGSEPDMPGLRVSTATPDLLARLTAALRPADAAVALTGPAEAAVTWPEPEPQAASAAARPWEHELADLLVDPGEEGASVDTAGDAVVNGGAPAEPAEPATSAEPVTSVAQAEPVTELPEPPQRIEAPSAPAAPAAALEIELIASQPRQLAPVPASSLDGEPVLPMPAVSAQRVQDAPGEEPSLEFTLPGAPPLPREAATEPAGPPQPPAPPTLRSAEPTLPPAEARPSPFALRPGEPWLASAARAAAAARAAEAPEPDMVKAAATASPNATASSATPAATAPEPAPAAATIAAAAMAPALEVGTADTSTPRRDYRALAGKVLRYTAIGFGIWMLVTLAAITLFRFVDPPGSMLMLSQRLGGGDVEQRWVPLGAISPQIVRAVVASEDSRFCSHWGIDPQEIAAAIERARDGVPRGASTITMQVAKNLFLWPSKSYVRKALEVPLTLAIELLWSKARILEVYLNIAEWGPGVFGIEAAARYHFNKAAKGLSRAEAALLAVSLPNPIRRDAGDPGSGTQRLGRIIEARMLNDPGAANCVLGRGR